jgi:hypothetical protein
MSDRKSAVLSMRLPQATSDRLEARGREADGKSALGQRYIEEGLRADEHPGIVFRSGPAGRRPGLASGPDVWEIIQALHNADHRGEAAVTATAEWMGLEHAQVETALRYYANYRDEIDAWIGQVQHDAARHEEAWRRRREALA